jgi:hypothetical protein
MRAARFEGLLRFPGGVVDGLVSRRCWWRRWSECQDGETSPRLAFSYDWGHGSRREADAYSVRRSVPNVRGRAPSEDRCDLQTGVQDRAVRARRFILAMSDDLQSTKARDTEALGEERLGARPNELAGGLASRAP